MKSLTSAQYDILATATDSLSDDNLTGRRLAISRGDNDQGSKDTLHALGFTQLMASSPNGGLALGHIELALINHAVGANLAAPEATLSLSAIQSSLRRRNDGPLMGELMETGLDWALAVTPVSAPWWSSPTATARRRSGSVEITSHQPLWAINGADSAQVVAVATLDSNIEILVMVDPRHPSVTRQHLSLITGSASDSLIELDGTPATVIGDADDCIGLRFGGTVASAAQALGAADRVLTLVLAHCASRQQFGQRIDAFQAVAHHCARAKCDLELIRAHLYRVAALQDDSSSTLDVLALRASVSSRIPAVMRTALHLFGGVGFTAEHPLHLFLKYAYYLAETFGNHAEATRQLAAHAVRCARVGGGSPEVH